MTQLLWYGIRKNTHRSQQLLGATIENDICAHVFFLLCVYISSSDLIFFIVVYIIVD